MRTLRTGTPEVSSRPAPALDSYLTPHPNLSPKPRAIFKFPTAPHMSLNLLSTPGDSSSGTISNKVSEELKTVHLMEEKVMLQRKGMSGLSL